MQNQINIKLSDLIKCPDDFCECGCPYFKQRNIIKRIPGLMIGSTMDQYKEMPFLACELCGKPHVSTIFEVPHFSVKGKA